MENYKIGDYQDIVIECWSRADLVGLRDLLYQEGCLDSENMFDNQKKAVELDEVQRRLSQKHHCNKKASADILLQIEDTNRKKLLLADAKFRVTNLINLDSKEMADKMKESKAIVLSDIPYVSQFYILLRHQAVSASKLNAIRRKFSNRPYLTFMDAVSFHQLFADTRK